MITKQALAKMMDHSLLKPFMTAAEIRAGCEEARQLDVASVCIRPSDIPLGAEVLSGSDLKLSTVIGFPHGTTTTHTKVAEAEEALRRGCGELDMVVNIGAVKSGDWSIVERDIAEVTTLTHQQGARLKVIFENCYLDDTEKIRLCEICSEIQVDWVKTSTGFGTGGATDEDLILMRKHVAPGVQVKAAGGIRNLARALRVHELGCTRFGCTVSAAILQEYDTGVETPSPGVEAY